MDAAQNTVFAIVVFARLVVPLAIPKYPLPAILASLVIDGVDQTIFQVFGMTSVLDDYQSYDKALDVYYLVIAYAASLRNWPDQFAFRVGQFLWYYRLIGVLAFEASQWQPVLLIFPNTFEYYFIAYEAVRTMWRPERLGHRAVLGLAAAIWIVVKLPQEWWIHVARLDATDEIGAHPVTATAAFLVLFVVLAVAVAWIRRTAPPPDWPFTVDVDAHQPERRPDPRPASRREWLLTTGEKALLVGMIVAIFGTILPTNVGSGILALTMIIITVLNAAASELCEWQQWMPVRIVPRFLLMAALNAVIFEVLNLLPGSVRFNRLTVSFFLLLLALVITLYDQYRGMRHAVTTRVPGGAMRRSTAGAH